MFVLCTYIQICIIHTYIVRVSKARGVQWGSASDLSGRTKDEVGQPVVSKLHNLHGSLTIKDDHTRFLF